MEPNKDKQQPCRHVMLESAYTASYQHPKYTGIPILPRYGVENQHVTRLTGIRAASSTPILVVR